MSYAVASFLTASARFGLAFHVAGRFAAEALRLPGGLRQALQRRSKPERTRRALANLLGLEADDLPAMVSPAASPDFLLLLARHVVEKQPECIVEFGSGVSTVILALAMKRTGRGRLISYDHSPGFADMTQRLAQRYGLEVDVRNVPLAPSVSLGYPGVWYEAVDLPESIDVLVIDGPPARLHPETRGGAGPAVFDRLSENGVVFLDDACRAGERAIAERWHREFPEIHFTCLPTSRGTLIGRKRQHRTDR